MNPLQSELELARSTVTVALKVLAGMRPEASKFGHEPSLPKEMKAEADRILEDIIVSRLHASGLDILSEETGLISGDSGDALRWML